MVVQRELWKGCPWVEERPADSSDRVVPAVHELISPATRTGLKKTQSRVVGSPRWLFIHKTGVSDPDELSMKDLRKSLSGHKPILNLLQLHDQIPGWQTLLRKPDCVPEQLPPQGGQLLHSLAEGLDLIAPRSREGSIGELGSDHLQPGNLEALELMSRTFHRLGESGNCFCATLPEELRALKEALRVRQSIPKVAQLRSNRAELVCRWQLIR
jgi:hypothetical protein